MVWQEPKSCLVTLSRAWIGIIEHLIKKEIYLKIVGFWILILFYTLEFRRSIHLHLELELMRI